MSNEKDKDYVCSLDEPSLKKAKEELNEDPRERLSSVQTFREWAESQPHLTCPTDTLTLLAFLRARKFSQLESRQLLEDFITIKTKHKQWFENLDLADPAIQAVLKEGFAFALPKRDKEGRLLLLVRFGHLQPWSGRYTKQDIFRTVAAMSIVTFFTDEMTQVNGVAVIDDLSALTMKHQTMFGVDEQKAFYGGWHKSIPARIKTILLYNLGGFGDFVLMLIKLIMPEKLQKRVKSLGNLAENLYKEVPMDLLPSDYLPDDYTGPHAGTIQENIDRSMELINDPKLIERVKYLTSPKFIADESKKPINAAQGSFRKLNVD